MGKYFLLFDVDRIAFFDTGGFVRDQLGVDYGFNGEIKTLHVVAFRYGKAIGVSPLTNAGAALMTAIIAIVILDYIPRVFKVWESALCFWQLSFWPLMVGIRIKTLVEQLAFVLNCPYVFGRFSETQMFCLLGKLNSRTFC
ncbi:MAG: hypothetical protein RIM83_00440 [Allomuricauda sp.]